MRALLLRTILKALCRWDRARLWLRMALHPGLRVDARAGSNFAAAEYQLAPGARLDVAAGAATERRAGALRFILERDAEVRVGERAWLRTDLGPVTIVAFAGARIEIGDDAFLNGAHVSAKRSVQIGRRAWIGPGSRVFDADQHDFDADHPEQVAPVAIGDCVWIASDVTVLRGVRIGDHSVIGARSLVNRDVPAHTVAFGVPAKPRGPVGDRSATR